eukprot:3502189-Rhodomonas_salina.1
MKWAPGTFLLQGQVWVWQPGQYQLLASVSSASATNLRLYWAGQLWVVILSNFQGPEPTTGDNAAASFLGSADVFKIGASVYIEEFIPYPCSRTENECSPVPWCLSQTFANITLRSLDSPAAPFLFPGMRIKVNDEIMMVIDVREADQTLADSDTLRAAQSFDFMDKAFDGFLLLESEGHPFVAPQDYRKAWASLSGDRARVS